MLQQNQYDWEQEELAIDKKWREDEEAGFGTEEDEEKYEDGMEDIVEGEIEEEQSEDGEIKEGAESTEGKQKETVYEVMEEKENETEEEAVVDLKLEAFMGGNDDKGQKKP